MRRLAWWLISLSAILLILLTTVVVLRVSLVERAAEAYLAAQGFPGASVSVVDIGFRSATLVNLELGPGWPKVERLEARYRIFELLGLRLRAIQIHGLRAQVNFQQLGPMKRLAALIPASAAGGPFVPGPDIQLKDAHINLTNTGIGDVILAVDGSADFRQPRARVLFEVKSLGLPRDFLKAVDQAELNLSAATLSEEGKSAPYALAGISAHLAGNEDELTVRADLEWAARQRFDVPMKLKADLQVRGLSLADNRLALVSWKSEGTVTGDMASIAGPLKAEAPILLRESLALRGVILEAGTKLIATPERRFAVLLTDGHAQISSPPVLEEVRVKGPVKFAIPSARLEHAPDSGLSVKAHILPEPVDAVFAPKQENDIELSATAKAIEASLKVEDGIAGQLELHDGAIRIPKKSINAEKIEVTMPFPFQPAGQPVLLSGRVNSTSVPALFSPIAISVRIAPEVDAFGLTGAVHQPSFGVVIPLRGKFARLQRRGQMNFGPVRLEFRPGALQPAMLAPALGVVKQARGAITLSGALKFTPDSPIDGKITIDLSNLTLVTAQGRINGLAGKLQLDRLFPPHTARVQTLSAQRVVVGLPLDKPTLRFRLEAKQARSTVLIERAEGRIAGGLVSLSKERFDPYAVSNGFDIGVQQLSLEQLLRDWAMTGISGTGTISGRIPVVLTSRGAAIKPTSLKAQGQGVLRVNWGSARDVLMRQSKEVALMVRALEDFHYSNLRVMVARPVDGSLSLRVMMEGRNPAVRSGYPFRFNISFSGNLDKILSAIAQGRRLGADLLQGGLGQAR